MASIPSSVTMASAKINLTPGEQQLRSLLLDVARYIDESKEIKERLELRFAGGWVRDKLLGIPSHDIDTAINAMTGYSFTLKIKEYLEDASNLTKHGLTAEDVGSLHKIAKNPEKSKHLETATVRILSYDVDFVNLRKETYSSDSRNPQMEFGTATEDALRRDATVNALFYNLHSDEVEDFTGGLADMQSKLIRTPLEPYQTFMDDPLRVLRLIRFASRLGFVIDPDSETSIANPGIQQALRTKISRERVGIEVEKMLKDKNRSTALQLIDRLGLYSTIFTDPSTKDFPKPSSERWYTAYDCLRVLMMNESPGSINKLLLRTEEAESLSWYIAALTPWAEVPTPATNKAGSKTPLPFASIVAREGIKLSNRTCDVITGAFRHFEGISALKEDVLAGKPYIYERDTLGMRIRKWDASGGHWKLHVLLAILVEAMRLDPSEGYDIVVSGWQQFLDHLQEIDVLEAPSQKRLIDGTQLAEALGIKPGKWMMQALDVCMEWQFRHPNETDTQGPIDEVKARAEQLQIPFRR